MIFPLYFTRERESNTRGIFGFLNKFLIKCHFSSAFYFICIVIAAITLMKADSASAATLDVCSSGCTYSAIQAAITAASSGDTINVAAGTYNENIVISKTLTVLTTVGAIIKPTTPATYTVQITAANIVFDGFEVDGSGVGTYGVRIASNDVILKNLNVHSFNDVLIYPSSITGANRLLVENCEIGQGSDFAVKPGSDGSVPSNDVTIRGCNIHNNDGIYIYKGSGWTIENNTIHDVELGITLDSGGGHIARNNLIYAFNKAGIKAEKTSTIVHNTISSSTAVDTSSYYGSGVAVKNAFAGGTIRDNIISSCIKGIYNRETLPSIILDYNDVWDNPLGNYVNGFTAGPHDISADPLFVDPSDPDPWTGFGLQCSSPAYNTASDGTNIGAWQGVPSCGDTTPPVITLLGDSTVNLFVGASYTDAGATAIDDVDGDITGSIVVVNPVNTDAVGTYTITYNVSDAALNPAVEVTRTVIVSVSDTAAPTATRGGSLPPKLLYPLKPPEGGFNVLINNGAEYTANPTVILSLRGGLDTARMAISNSPDFKDTGQETYQTTKSWNLYWQNSFLQTPSDCPAGTYTVYVKFYAPWGKSSETVSDTIIYKTGNIEMKKCGLDFTKYIRLGYANDPNDVIKLKTFLRDHEGETGLVINGTYDNVAEEAVIRFQEKYAEDVLTPWGEVKGTGYVYKTTTKKINELMCGNITTPALTSAELQATPTTLASGHYNFTVDLKIGSQGKGVNNLQKVLNSDSDTLVASKGAGSIGNETTFFGPRTKLAVIRFQKKYGISPAVGYVGSITKAKLNTLMINL